MGFEYQRNHFNGKSPWRYDIGTMFKCQDLKFKRAKLSVVLPIKFQLLHYVCLTGGEIVIVYANEIWLNTIAK